MHQQQRYKHTNTAIQLILSIAVFIVALLIFLNRQYILDSYALYRYEPTDQVVQLRNNAAFSEEGERYFYVSRPEVNEAAEFNENCRAYTEESIILGCYTGNKVFLFNVTDERLDGIKEVTAAHEMLHAAYDRLSKNERTDVNTLLDIQMSQVTDERILDLIELYRKKEPSHIQNEMHSIFATELNSLTPELERYYSQYFTDRQMVVNYSQRYESVFTEIEKRQQQIVRQLNALSETIKQRSSVLNQQSEQLARDIISYNRRADTPGGFDSQASANQQRAPLVERRETLQRERSEILALIEEARVLENEYTVLLGELENLNKTIDSTPEELPSMNEG